MPNISVKFLYDSGVQYVDIPDNKIGEVVNSVLLNDSNPENYYNVDDFPNVNNQDLIDFEELLLLILTLQLFHYRESVSKAKIKDLINPFFLNNTKIKVDNVINDYYKSITDSTIKFYEKGKTDSINDIKREKVYQVVDNHAITNLINNNVNLIQNVTDDLHNTIKKIIKEGIDNQLTVDEIAKNIEKSGLSDLETKNGRKIPANHRAKMIAHTEMSRALNQARYNTYLEYGVENVRWVSRDWKRRCNSCLSMDLGSPYNILEFIPPPLHPFCVCYFLPDGDYSEVSFDVLSFLDFTTGNWINVNPTIPIIVPAMI